MVNPLYHFAELLILESHTTDLSQTLELRSLAVTLLSYVRNHPDAWQIFKDKAAQLQAAIEGMLLVEVRAAAIARGQHCTLEEMVSMLLNGELDALVDDPKEAVQTALL